MALPSLFFVITDMRLNPQSKSWFTRPVRHIPVSYTHLAVAAVAEQNARIELAFGEHEVTLSAESAYGRSSAPVKALVLSAPATPDVYKRQGSSSTKTSGPMA